MLDDKPKSSGLQNLISIPGAIFGGIFPIDGSRHEMAAVLGLLTIVSLVLWDKLKRGRLKLIPGALIGVVTDVSYPTPEETVNSAVHGTAVMLKWSRLNWCFEHVAI